MTNKPKTLYHYCSIESFLSIITKKTVWFSDIGKSNDSNEMHILQRKYYDFVYNKYQSIDSQIEKECCKFLVSVATVDGFRKEIPILNRIDLAEKLMETYKSLRAYCFCMTELKDSLGQWRGYADNGNGLAIGFSRKYLENLVGNSVLCPISNFFMLSVIYEKNNMDKFCEVIYNSSKKDNPVNFLTTNLEIMFRLSAFFKSKSFKEEKEWRIVYCINNAFTNNNILSFEQFAKVTSDTYKENFETPQMIFTPKKNDIISRIEVGIKNMSAAINHIVIGPKSSLTENDIKQILIKEGIIKNIYDNKIIVSKSESSYR